MASPDIPQLLADLRELAQLYLVVPGPSNKHRAQTFAKAANQLAEMYESDQPFPHTKAGWQKLSGIGPSLAQDLQGWFKSGQIQRLIDLRLQAQEVRDRKAQAQPHQTTKKGQKGQKGKSKDIKSQTPGSSATATPTDSPTDSPPQFKPGSLTAQILAYAASQVIHPSPDTESPAQYLAKNDKKIILQRFSTIYGVGPKTAQKWYDVHGWREWSDIQPDKLNQKQKLGLVYHSDIQQRIPRKEIQHFEQRLRILLADLTWQICGSYRRGLADSGDVDLLVQLKSGLDMKQIRARLLRAGVVVADLAQGETKYMGIAQLQRNCPKRRLDIRLISPESWPFAQLYFTGDYNLNISMRQLAILQGGELSEYGLKLSTGPVECKTEEDIFQALGMDYLAPEERCID